MNRDDDLHPDDEFRRQCLVRLLTFAGMSTLPVGAVQAAFWGGKPDKLADDRSIFSLEGDVRVNGQSADLQTRIRGGDVVSTADRSEVVFAVGRIPLSCAPTAR